jgi:hypothetical protein
VLDKRAYLWATLPLAVSDPTNFVEIKVALERVKSLRSPGLVRCYNYSLGAYALCCV